MHKILIGLSIDAVGAARLPQVLAAAQCEVTLISSGNLAVASSRFVAHHIPAGRSPLEVRGVLERHVTENPDLYSCVLLADEPLLRTFMSVPAVPALTRLAPIVADSAKLARILSKVSFSLDARQAGIAVPDFRVLNGSAELARETWPGRTIVVKAEESLSGSGVRVIHDAAEMEAVKSDMVSGPLLLQEYSSGRVGATAVLFDQGVPVCWFSYFLCRNWPNAFASASAIEIFWHRDIEPMLVKLGQMTGFHGLCGVDWVLDERTGNPLLLEMNPRPTPGIYLGHFAGVSFPQAISRWLDRESVVQRPDAKPSAGLHRMFPQNLFRAIDDRDPSEFVRTWADAPWSDPKLLLSNLRRVGTHYIPSTWRGAVKRRLGRS